MNTAASPDDEFLALQDALAGQWSLERELGRGGMATVYLARDVSLDRPVAIKVLAADHAADPTMRARFEREAITSAALSHPHIAPTYAVAEAAGRPYLVMGYIDGESLAQRLHRTGPLSVAEGESMTNAPHLLPGSRTGVKYGNFEALDHMAWDGLVNPYDKQAMGVFGEQCADKYAFTRDAQDAYAIESVQRALAAQASGAFKNEIAPVTIAGRKGDVVIDSDEQPGRPARSSAVASESVRV